MDKTNQELFKQALVEGVNRRIDRDIAACEEDIVYSRKHKKVMARIIKGKEIKKPINRKVIAILVAAAVLLLAGCAIIYRNEIRDFITEVYEFFVEIEFSEGENESKYIEEVYELTYIPEGYELEKYDSNIAKVQYIYKNEQGYYIIFVQQPLDISSFTVDSEHDYDKIMSIGQYEIYYRQTNRGAYYIWNDGKYALSLDSSVQLSEQTIELIIDGIKTK